MLGTQFALAAAPERSLEPGEDVAALLSAWCPPSCILNLIKAKPDCPLCCSVVSGFLAGVIALAVADVESGAAEARHRYHQAQASGNRCRAATAVRVAHHFFWPRISVWSSRQEAQGGSVRLISTWRA